MDIGTGIPVGCGIITAGTVLFKVLSNKKNNNPNLKQLDEKIEKVNGKFDKVQRIDVCDERFEGLKSLIKGGFEQVNNRLDQLNK